MKFEFIAKHRGVWRTSLMCEVLGVSRAGLDDWMRRPAGPRHATAPNQRWVADFTFIWTDEGRL